MDDNTAQTIDTLNRVTERIMTVAGASRVDVNGFTDWRWTDGSVATLEDAYRRVGNHPSMRATAIVKFALERELVNG